MGGGVFEGAITGIKVGGTLGLAIDLAYMNKGSMSTYDSSTAQSAYSMYVAAWSGSIGLSSGFSFGGSEKVGGNDYYNPNGGN